MKKWIALWLLISVLCACGTANAHDPWILKYSSHGEAGSIIELTASAFNGAVINGTDDNIELEIYQDGALGDLDAVLSSITGKSGAIDAASLPDDALIALGCDALKVLNAPYLFRDDAHLKSFLKTTLVQTIQEQIQPKKEGLSALALLDAGFYGFALRESAEHLEGLAIAVPDEAGMPDLVRALGGEPVILDRQGAIDALRAGAVDGMEATLEQYDAYGLSDCAPFFLQDHHRLNVYVIVMGGETWSRALNRERKQLLEAGQYAMDFCTKFRSNREVKYLEAMADAGVTLISADPAALKDRCQSVIQQIIRGNEALYREITNVQ